MNWNDLLTLRFEMALTVFILLQLVIKIFDLIRNNESLLRFNVFFIALVVVLGFFGGDGDALFGGMFVTGKLIDLQKTILTFATLLVLMQSYEWLKAHAHMPEFFILLSTALLGMFMMLSSNNILLFYLGLEMATNPVAALANFDLEKQRSSEAGMKMILSSAFSSGMLLFGISILYGVTGTLSLSLWQQMLQPGPLEVMALILIISGFAFKISLVPFHLWTADVYEGAPVSITAFLSVVSKGAVSFALARFLFHGALMMHDVWIQILFFLSVITITTGNIFAIRQTNLKRFLAFSTVAQAGYILLGLAGTPENANASVLYFILIYAFSNLAALGVVQAVSVACGKEEINDFKGFYNSHKFLAVILMLGLFSLAGIPPAAGFFGKLFLFTSGVQSASLVWLLVAGLNLVISLYYYMRVVRIMFSDNADAPLAPIQLSMFPKVSLIICGVGILVTGYFGGLYDYLLKISW